MATVSVKLTLEQANLVVEELTWAAAEKRERVGHLPSDSDLGPEERRAMRQRALDIDAVLNEFG
jgi:hypothetical protein